MGGLITAAESNFFFKKYKRGSAFIRDLRVQWKESELKDKDRKSRRTVTMYGALHLKSDVDRLYIKRKEGGRGLISVEHCVKEEQNSLGFYVANSEENLI